MTVFDRLTKFRSANSSSSGSKFEGHESYELKDPALTTIQSGDESSETEDVQLNSNGAPIEKHSPLGSNVDTVSLIYLTVSGVIGTGIFSTPGTILKSVGSVGASYVLWCCGFLIACLRLMVYIEYIQYFPHRAGGDVAYLEQAYPNPPFMVPTSYAAVSIVLSFLNSSAISFGNYILKAADTKNTVWRQRGIAVGILAFTSVLAGVSTKWALRVSNILGHAKIISLLFISITGFVVLGGHTSVENPKANFQNAWSGTTKDASSISNAILKVTFAYGGLQYPTAVVNELPYAKRMRGYKTIVPVTFFLIFVLYILTITAYFAGAGSLKEIKSSGTLTASLFFENVFKTKAATRALSVLVALSAYGHLIPAVVSHSRALRECGRQGVLPFKSFWVSTKPFGTPLGPIFVTWLVNSIVSIAPPAGSAYNFVVDLGSYSGYIFDFQLSLGLILLRRQRQRAGIPRGSFQIPLPLLILQQLYQVFVLIMPLVPPKDSKGKITTIGTDIDFFYASYCVVAVGLLLLCFAYYVLWQFILPYFGKYRHRVETYTLENGELGNRVIQVKLEDLEEFDRVHGKRLTLGDVQPRNDESEAVTSQTQIHESSKV